MPLSDLLTARLNKPITWVVVFLIVLPALELNQGPPWLTLPLEGLPWHLEIIQSTGTKSGSDPGWHLANRKFQEAYRNQKDCDYEVIFAGGLGPRHLFLNWLTRL